MAEDRQTEGSAGVYGKLFFNDDIAVEEERGADDDGGTARGSGCSN